MPRASEDDDFYVPNKTRPAPPKKLAANRRLAAADSSSRSGKKAKLRIPNHAIHVYDDDGDGLESSFKRKRPRRASISGPTMPIPKGGEKNTEDQEKIKTRKHSLEDFIFVMDDLMDEVIALEGSRTPVGELCECGIAKRTTRCFSCPRTALLCDACFLKSHSDSPFHHVEKWNGTRFVKGSQTQIGRVLHVGHCGGACPELPPDAAPLMLDVVDISGVHPMLVHYCVCKTINKNEKWRQLVRRGLVPGTTAQPSTAFTTSLLKLHHLISTIGKLSTMDFNPYEALLRASRVWSNIQIRKRSGYCHGIGNVVPHLEHFPLASRCPACPRPGVNMSEDGIEITMENGHKYTLFLSMDGNFHLQLKKKRRVDDDEEELYTAFFVPKEVFDRYLRGDMDDLEKSTCAYLKSTNLQNILKFRSMIVSGVVVVKCARHDFYMPAAAVDLHLGEKFSYTDFALRQALEDYDKYPKLVVTYDNACQYTKKLQTRWKQSPTLADRLDTIKAMLAYLPKLHGHGHVDDCFYNEALDWNIGCGRLGGELIEGGWSRENPAGKASCEMTTGRRHEFLSDGFNEANRQKEMGMVSVLVSKKMTSRVEAFNRTVGFESLCDSLGPEKVAAFEKMLVDAESKNERSAVSALYRPTSTKMPSLRVIKEQLMKEKGFSVAIAGTHDDVVAFVSEGIRLETRQLVLRRKLAGERAKSERIQLEIQKERLALYAALEVWRTLQQQLMPGLDKLIAEQTVAASADEKGTPITEEIGLLLPSALSDEPGDFRSQKWYGSLRDIECQLRRGEANDAIQSLVLAIHVCKQMYQDKRSFRGNRHQTRAQVAMDECLEVRAFCVVRYEHARAALLRVGTQKDEELYKKLAPPDMDLKTVYATKQLGEGTKTDSWLSEFGTRSSQLKGDLAKWHEDGVRVGYFRKRIDMIQWKEEDDIIDSEMERVFNTYVFYSHAWTQLAEAHQNDRDRRPGYVEYAREVADVYARRAEECKVAFGFAVGDRLVAKFNYEVSSSPFEYGLRSDKQKSV